MNLLRVYLMWLMKYIVIVIVKNLVYTLYLNTVLHILCISMISIEPNIIPILYYDMLDYYIFIFS